MSGSEERRKGYEDVIAHMAATNVKLEDIHTDIVELKDKVKIQNGRIGKLESEKWMVVGAGIVIISILKFIFK